MIHYTTLERPARNKHSSLGPIQKSQRKKMLLIQQHISYNNRGLYFKTLWFCNLEKLYRFCNRLVSFLLSVTCTNLDKQTSFLWNPSITNLYSFRTGSWINQLNFPSHLTSFITGNSLSQIFLCC